MNSRVISGMAMLLALPACYHGVGADDPHSTTAGSLYPRGVLTASPADDDILDSTGIFPSTAPDDPDCCWAGRSASFDTRRKATSKYLRLIIFIPDLKPYMRRQQGVAVSIDDSSPRHFDHLQVGSNIVRVPLQPSQRSTEHVVLTANFTFSPKDEGINDDSRQLAYYVKSAIAR